MSFFSHWAFLRSMRKEESQHVHNAFLVLKHLDVDAFAWVSGQEIRKYRKNCTSLFLRMSGVASSASNSTHQSVFDFNPKFWSWSCDCHSFPARWAIPFHLPEMWVQDCLFFMQVNYNLMTVNIAMAATGLYQLYRKISYDLEAKPQNAVQSASS